MCNFSEGAVGNNFCILYYFEQKKMSRALCLHARSVSANVYWQAPEFLHTLSLLSLQLFSTQHVCSLEVAQPNYKYTNQSPPPKKQPIIDW